MDACHSYMSPSKFVNHTISLYYASKEAFITRTWCISLKPKGRKNHVAFLSRLVGDSQIALEGIFLGTCTQCNPSLDALLEWSPGRECQNHHQARPFFIQWTQEIQISSADTVPSVICLRTLPEKSVLLADAGSVVCFSSYHHLADHHQSQWLHHPQYHSWPMCCPSTFDFSDSLDNRCTHKDCLKMVSNDWFACSRAPGLVLVSLVPLLSNNISYASHRCTCYTKLWREHAVTSIRHDITMHVSNPFRSLICGLPDQALVCWGILSF